MTLSDLTTMTRFYCRDSNGFMFNDTDIQIFINQGIDRIKQFDKIFDVLTHLNTENDEPLLPSQYHYMLALFSASRMFENDERFYEGTQKRNEFEQLLQSLLDDIQAGNVVLKDEYGEDIPYSENGNACIDYVTDEYFSNTVTEEEEV